MSDDQSDVGPIASSEPRSGDDVELRRSAGKRSWPWLDARSVSAGHGICSLASFAAALGIVPAVAWFAFRPTAVSFWTSFAVIVIAMMLWMVGLIARRNTVLRTRPSSILDRIFIASACTLCVAAVLAAGLLATAFGSLRMVGSFPMIAISSFPIGQPVASTVVYFLGRAPTRSLARAFGSWAIADF